MNIGGNNTCACGWCSRCSFNFPLWAQPVYIYTDTKTTLNDSWESQFQMRRLEKWLSLPKYKLHADGSCTKLMDGLGSLGISFGQL
jgi:hypothetical protein